jgi:hypothetical protein
MTNYYLHCTLSGNNFYPSKNIDLFSKFILNFNDKGSIDFDRNCVYKYGYVALSPKQDEENFFILFNLFIDNLIILKNNLPKFRYLNPIIHLDIAYNGQCNFELSKKELQKINKLGAVFTITCYESIQ